MMFILVAEKPICSSTCRGVVAQFICIVVEVAGNDSPKVICPPANTENTVVLSVVLVELARAKSGLNADEGLSADTESCAHGVVVEMPMLVLVAVNILEVPIRAPEAVK